MSVVLKRAETVSGSRLAPLSVRIRTNRPLMLLFDSVLPCTLGPMRRVVGGEASDALELGFLEAVGIGRDGGVGAVDDRVEGDRRPRR